MASGYSRPTSGAAYAERNDQQQQQESAFLIRAKTRARCDHLLKGYGALTRIDGDYWKLLHSVWHELASHWQELILSEYRKTLNATSHSAGTFDPEGDEALSKLDKWHETFNMYWRDRKLIGCINTLDSLAFQYQLKNVQPPECFQALLAHRYPDEAEPEPAPEEVAVSIDTAEEEEE